MTRPEKDAGTEAVRETGATISMHAADVSVTTGADAGEVRRIDQPTFIIGTGPTADLRLSDVAVSREHVLLSLTPNGIRLRDGGSKNGTWIGGVRAFDVLLVGSCDVKIGRTTLALRIDGGLTAFPLSDSETFGNAIGVSPIMRHLFALLERASSSDITVLLEGESGVGKEVLAEAIHARSPRSSGPFVVVNCGAIPIGLIESELFGHERGAFTGAERTHVGVFEQASGGTLFLDEIGELALEVQPKLLRVLEQREVKPLGSRVTKHVDVRVIAATNRKLAEAAQRNEFRRDLFYRLAVARVTVPPLRDRREDIVPLARAFQRMRGGEADADIDPDLARMLEAYPWPGNVRELRNVMERHALLGVRDAVGLFDHNQPLPAGSADLSHLPFQEARRIAIERFERDYVPKVLERAGGVVTRAAEHAQVARPSFHRIMERLRLVDGDDDESAG